MYANPACPAGAGCPCDVARLPYGPHRVATRLVMILLSQRGWPASTIADLLGTDPSTVRRWIGRYNTHGVAGLADRPRSGRPRLGSPRLGARILRLLGEAMAWTIPRLWQRLGQPAMSLRTLHRRVGGVAAWRRPRPVARGDPHRDQVLTTLRQQLTALPQGAGGAGRRRDPRQPAALVRATWIAHGQRQLVMTSGTNRRRTIFGAVDVRTGQWCYRLPARQSARPSAFCEHRWPPCLVVVRTEDVWLSVGNIRCSGGLRRAE